MKIKSGKPLIDVLKVAYQANQPVMLVGTHGIGKSQIIESAAQQLSINSKVLDLSIMENTDLAGMPHIENDEMKYTKPSNLPIGGKGLLVFEELNRCPRYMQAPCLQLLTARRLNDYSLPEGWLPCACINPVDEGYITEELDLALQSRFLCVEVVADVQEWLKWSEHNGIDEQVMEFVSATPRIFDADKSNPRSWSYVSNILQAVNNMNGSEETLLASISGLVGDELALAFLNFSKGSEKPLEADAIIERYDEKAVRKQVLQWKEMGQFDMLKATLHKLEVVLQSASNWQEASSCKKHKQNIRKFIRDLPADLRKNIRGLVLDLGDSTKVK